MKYIDADRLKAKLDEHYRKYQSMYMETRTPYTQGLIDALDLAEQVIDSLESEKPVPKYLEEAANEYAEKHGFRVPYDGSENFYDDFDVKASKEGFIAGAKWDRQQMMKGAVEGLVYFANGDDRFRVKSDEFVSNNIHFGDKVRVIVIPNTKEK